MSGHSKFANIKHKKEKNDAAKGKIFTKIGREIAVAVKEGGGADPANNSRLRDAIAKAKANNMPNDNIERSIKKAAGDGDANNYEHIVYEGLTIVTVPRQMYEALLRKEKAISEPPAAFPSCLTRRDRSLSIRKNVNWMRMI